MRRRGPLLVNRSRSRRGQAAVEFALAAAVFLLVTLGIIQFALLFHYRLVLTHAGREGVRFAAVREAPNLVSAVAQTRLAAEQRVRTFIRQRAVTLNPPLRDEDIPTIEVVTTQGGGVVQVTLRYDLVPTVPVVGSILRAHGLPARLRLEINSTMRLEQR